jgi:hypothetical protein
MDSEQAQLHQQAIAMLEQALQQKEQTIAALTDQALKLDARLEERLNFLVGKIAELKDSKDTRTRVARLKQEAIDGLGKSLENYRRMRRNLEIEQSRGFSYYSKEQGDQAAQFLDRKVEERLDQVQTLGSSLHQSEDYNKYVTTFQVDGDELAYRNVKNPDYYQNQRQTWQADRSREGVIFLLNREISELETKNNNLKQQMQWTANAAQRQELTNQFEANTA